MISNSERDALLRLLAQKRRVFVSYHHHGDRVFYDAFAKAVMADIESVQDNSVDRVIDSDNSDYVIRAIRENYVTGTSCTFVLCGSATPFRKFVDWEIKATLDACHGLVGVNLPTNPLTSQQTFTVPERLHDNIVSGYAVWTTWAAVTDPLKLKATIEAANSRPSVLINNSRELRRRNG